MSKKTKEYRLSVSAAAHKELHARALKQKKLVREIVDALVLKKK